MTHRTDGELFADIIFQLRIQELHTSPHFQIESDQCNSGHFNTNLADADADFHPLNKVPHISAVDSWWHVVLKRTKIFVVLRIPF